MRILTWCLFLQFGQSSSLATFTSLLAIYANPKYMLYICCLILDLVIFKSFKGLSILCSIIGHAPTYIMYLLFEYFPFYARAFIFILNYTRYLKEAREHVKLISFIPCRFFRHRISDLEIVVEVEFLKKLRRTHVHTVNSKTRMFFFQI